MTWRTVYLAYPCPTCGAQPAEPCATTGGRTAYIPHAARTRHGDRCPKCGTILEPATPGALCPRCALVRSLEVERATRYRRRDP